MMSDDGGSLVIIDLVMVGIVKRALHSISEASGGPWTVVHALGPCTVAFGNKVVAYRYLESETLFSDIEIGNASVAKIRLVDQILT
jgi:hypothetical protein